MQGLKDSFKKGVFWNGVSVFGGLATHFLGALVFAYFMEPEDFRLVGILLILMNQAFVLSEFGLATAIVQAKDLRPVHLNTIFVINLAIGIALTALFCALSPAAAWFFKSPILTPIMIMVSVVFFILSTGLTHKARLARDVDFFSLSMAEVYGYVAYIVVLTLLAWRRKGVWAFVWAKVAQQSVETSALWISAKFTPDLRNISFREAKPMFHFGLNMSGAQMVAFLIGNLDGFLVGRFYPQAAAGYYLFARQVVIVPAVRFLKLLTRVGVPILSRIQDDLPRMARSFCLMNKFLALLALPAFLGLSAVAPEMVHAIFRPKWYPIVGMVSILSISVAAHLFAALTIVVYYSLARANVLMRFQILVLAVRTVLLCSVVFFTRNVIYICWAILFERLFFMVFFERLAFRLMLSKSRSLFSHLANPLIASVLMVAATLLISRLAPGHPLTRSWATILLTLQVATGAAVYIGFILLKDRHVVEEMKTFLASRRGTKTDQAQPPEAPPQELPEQPFDSV